MNLERKAQKAAMAAIKKSQTLSFVGGATIDSWLLAVCKTLVRRQSTLVEKITFERVFMATLAAEGGR